MVTSDFITIGGVALLAVGILGGGVAVKEINVPKLPALSRLAAVIGGAALIYLGAIHMQTLAPVTTGVNPDLAEAASALTPAPVAPVPAIAPAIPAVETVSTPAPQTNAPELRTLAFTISDELGTDQAAEQVVIEVDGDELATITLDTDTPKDSVRIELERPASDFTNDGLRLTFGLSGFWISNEQAAAANTGEDHALERHDNTLVRFVKQGDVMHIKRAADGKIDIE